MKVFVSSTSKDLHAHRDTVRQALDRARITKVGMEDFPSQPADPTTVCKAEIAQCDVFVGIYADRYGHIPHGSDRSITEQEYHYARELKKPCLGFILDTRHSLVRSPEEGFEGIRGWWKARRMQLRGQATPWQKLAAFKAQVQRELVVDFFTTPDNLARSVVQALHRMKAGNLPELMVADLLRGWAKHASETGDRLLRPRDTQFSVASPLRTLWRSFAEAQPWHERMRANVRALDEAAAALPRALDGLLLPENSAVQTMMQTATEQLSRLAALPVRLDAVDFTANYHVIRAELAQICREGRECANRLAKITFNLQDSYRQDRRYALLLQRLARCDEANAVLLGRLEVLIGALEHPTFQTLFATTGRAGAGKTHFVAKLLKETREQERYLVLRRSSAPKDLENHILDAARHATHFPWSSFEQFARFIAGKHVVIIIDDLQHWIRDSPAFLEEFQAFVCDHTSVHAQRWLITLEDSSYNLLHGTTTFWSEYAYAAADAPHMLSGWIALNDLNEQKGLGLQVLEAAAAQDARIRPHLPLLKTGASKHLSVPFIARIVIDLLRDGKIPPVEIVNLNYVEFVDHFWLRLKGRLALDSANLRAIEVEQAVFDVARLLPTMLPDKSRDHWMYRLLASPSAPANYAKAEAALDLLIRERLLDSEVDGDVGERPIEEIRAGFDTFWQFQIACQRKPPFIEEVRGALRPSEIDLATWFTKIHDHSLDEGILEFLFLLLDSDKAAEDARLERLVKLIGVTQTALRHLGPALWFAGAKASATLQRGLTRPNIHTLIDPNDRRWLFAVIYFVANADSSIALDARLLLLQPYYPQMQDDEQIRYFRYTVERLYSWGYDGAALAVGMVALSGVEALGPMIAQDLAGVCLKALARKADLPAKPSSFDLAALRQITAWISEYAAQFAPNDTELDEKPWRRTRFREWLLHEFCETLVARLGFGAYDLLKETEWFAGGSQSQVGKDKQREAASALGSYFRCVQDDAKDSQRYVEIVKELRSGDDVDKEVAFFLILHSISEERRLMDRIDPRLCPALEQLSREPSLAWLRRGGDFAEFVRRQITRCAGR